MCPVGCEYCYARRMYKRFKWDPEIRFDKQVLFGIDRLKKPSRIFVGSTFELFGEWVKEEWLLEIFRHCYIYPQHTFIFLTKQPQNLPREFPDNCWVGVSATDRNMSLHACQYLRDIKASVKYLSLEPLLDWVDKTSIGFLCELDDAKIQWLIIGAQTPYSPKTTPKQIWVEEIVEACDKANIPVFLKNNLVPILENREPFIFKCKEYQQFPRQELPDKE